MLSGHSISEEDSYLSNHFPDKSFHEEDFSLRTSDLDFCLSKTWPHPICTCMCQPMSLKFVRPCKPFLTVLPFAHVWLITWMPPTTSMSSSISASQSCKCLFFHADFVHNSLYTVSQKEDTILLSTYPDTDIFKIVSPADWAVCS